MGTRREKGKKKGGLAKRAGEPEAYEGLNMAPEHNRPIVKMQKCSYAFKNPTAKLIYCIIYIE